MFGRMTRTKRIVLQILTTLLVLPFAFPLFTIISRSGDGAGFAENYRVVLTETPILRFALNSAVISGGTIALVYLCTMAAAYAFSKLTFPGRQALFLLLLGGLVLPSIALIVPLFAIVRSLDLFNNYLAVILPLTATITPFTLLLAKNYLDGVPTELLEAAKLDGAGEFQAMLRIVLPLAKPISAVVIVWTFLQSWNEFFLPLLMMQRADMQAITQVPTYFSSMYGSDVPKIFAAIVVISFPVAVMYLLFQRYFERGLTAGALK